MKPSTGDLARSYEAAWDEWFESGEEEIWSVAIADGLDDEPVDWSAT